LWYGRLFPFLQVLCLLLESKNVLAALSCSLIRFRKCSPFSFLFGFPWSPSRSGLKSLWNSNSTSPSCLWGPFASLVPMEALTSAPMMVVVFLLGRLLRNLEKSCVVLSISSSG